MSNSYDVLIIGAGIIGLATARQIRKRSPKAKILVLDKEQRIAAHQSSHNSGVVHSGIYYPPKSLKAQTCTEGRASLLQWCLEHEIAFEQCGKVILANSDQELTGLKALFHNGQRNGLKVRIISPEELKEIEPYAQAKQALFVPETAIVDFGQVCAGLAKQIQAQGVELQLDSEVIAIHNNVVHTTRFHYQSRCIVNCAGLHADEIAKKSGLHPGIQIIPFRGEYFALRPHARHLCRNLIYPPPNPSLPFLGVHVSRRIDGRVDCGPNAVLALAREGYRKQDLSWPHTCSLLKFPGFYRLAWAHFGTGAYEWWRSHSKRSFARSVARLIPEITISDLGSQSTGIRAQAVDSKGRLLHDFVLKENEHTIHVLNSPSPAATASLAIAKRLSDLVALRIH